MVEFLHDPEVWVGIGFAVVIIGFIWLGLPRMVTSALDARAASIAAELDTARKLREEAEGVLAQYRRKAQDVEVEAAAILAAAHEDADRFAADARTQLAVQIERRTKQAQDKIAQAEAAAMAEIRVLAADAAAGAAEKLIAARLDEKRAGALIADSIKDLPGKLN
ncbi:MAG TPA: ATP F0F1 synthase subunit B [Rhizomicrobium sp.]|jgi:F-type H+-transporting ATPase subunit b|nr:ATP F0F1 synthase subunit B [Rhizomicrobium sp.]